MVEFNKKQLEILRIAEKLFAKKGFSATSIRDISHEANINISMISYYFGSKDKLIEAVFELRSSESRKVMEGLLLDNNLSPIQKVNYMIESNVSRLIGNQCFYNIMLREQLSEDKRTPIIYEVLHDLKMRNLQSMRQLITEGQQLGHFRKDIDETLLFNCLFGTIHQTLNTKTFYLKVNNLETLTETEVDDMLKKDLCKYLTDLFSTYLLVENKLLQTTID
jgi:AcrR family transcriptional regulator